MNESEQSKKVGPPSPGLGRVSVDGVVHTIEYENTIGILVRCNVVFGVLPHVDDITTCFGCLADGAA